MKLSHLLPVLLALSACPALAAAPIMGKWLTTERDSIIEIGHCGPLLCGKVVRVMKRGTDGKAMRDFNNPDATQRSRPIEGINVLSNLSDNGGNWKGRIYDPRSGKSYKSFVTLNPDATLKVQGCIGFICKTVTWTAVR